MPVGVGADATHLGKGAQQLKVWGCFTPFACSGPLDKGGFWYAGSSAILGLRHHQLRWSVTLARARCEPTRLQGCLPNPPDTEHAITHPSLSACVPACVQRLRSASARAARVSHQKPIRPKNASPAARPSPTETGGKMKKDTVCAMFSAQRRRPHLRKKSRSLDRRLARHVRLPPKPTLRGPFLKGLSDAGDAGDVSDAGTPRCWGCWRSLRRCRGCWRGCWRLSGAICTVFTVVLKVGQRGIRSPSQGQEGRDVLGSKCLGRPACSHRVMRSIYIWRHVLAKGMGGRLAKSRHARTHAPTHPHTHTHPHPPPAHPPTHPPARF